MTADSPILIDERAGYRVITLNRPDKLNAFNEAMHLALRKAIDGAEADETCRALLITGTGRGFCTGQDLSDRLAKPGETVVLGGAQEAYYNPLVRRLRSLPFPVVAAVNGVAAGAGCNIALACDIVIAGLKAKFIQSFARVGLIPDSGGTWFLPRLRRRSSDVRGNKNLRALRDGADARSGVDKAGPECIRHELARCAA